MLKGCTPLQHSVGTGGFEKGFAQGVTLAADPSSELVPAGGTLGGDEEDEGKSAGSCESGARAGRTTREAEGCIYGEAFGAAERTRGKSCRCFRGNARGVR